MHDASGADQKKRKRDWRLAGEIPISVTATDAIGIVQPMETTMRTWNAPQVREQAVGLEVTSYLPAEIDLV